MGLLDNSTDPTDPTFDQGFGDAFGGAGAGLLAPTVGQEGMSAARNNALMSIGAAMAQASAPSFDPSHRSLAAALGAGVTAGQNAYQGSMERGIKTAQAGQALQMGKYNMAKQAMLLRAAQAMLPQSGTQAAPAGAPAPTADSSVAAVQGGGATAFPVPPGGVPISAPSGSSSAPVDTTGEGAPGQPPTTHSAALYPNTPTASSEDTTGLNPAGMPGPIAAAMLLNNTDEFFKAQAAAVAPTDLEKYMRVAGIPKASPQGQAMIQAAITKQNYIAPTSVRPGGYTKDPTTGAMTWAPQVPAGAMPQFVNGQFTGVTAMPGAADVAKQQAAAAAIGGAYGKNVPGVDASGNPIFVNQGRTADALTSGGPGAPSPGGPPQGAIVMPPAGPGGAPLPNGGAADGVNPPLPPGGIPGVSPQGAGAFPVPPGGVPVTAPTAAVPRPSLSVAGAAAAQELGEKAAQQLAADRAQSSKYAGMQFTLGKALTGLQNADTGPESDTVNQARSFMLAQGPQALQSLGIVNPNKVMAYDEANKYLTQIAIQQAGSMGEGTDAKLAATIAGNANTHISNLAAQDVVRANIALTAMQNAQVQQFGKTGLPAEQYPTWASQFQSKIDPRVFAWNSLPTDKKQIAFKAMSPAQRQNFQGQYNWALQNNYLPQGQ